jgi:hypothetical protein
LVNFTGRDNLLSGVDQRREKSRDFLFLLSFLPSLFRKKKVNRESKPFPSPSFQWVRVFFFNGLNYFPFQFISPLGFSFSPFLLPVFPTLQAIKDSSPNIFKK